MVGWHLRLHGHELEQAPGVGDGQGGLTCCRQWAAKSRTRLSEELNRRDITENLHSCLAQVVSPFDSSFLSFRV